MGWIIRSEACERKEIQIWKSKAREKSEKVEKRKRERSKNER